MHIIPIAISLVCSCARIVGLGVGHAVPTVEVLPCMSWLWGMKQDLRSAVHLNFKAWFAVMLHVISMQMEPEVTMCACSPAVVCLHVSMSSARSWGVI